MKLRCLLLVCLLVCLLLTACQTENHSYDGNEAGEHTSAVTDAPTNQIPSEINFEVNCVCELTDPDGKTLHSGGAFVFYGMIEGTPGHMIYGDPTMFEFTVPYRDSYTFQADAKEMIIDACVGHSSRLFCSGYNEIVWKADGWVVKGAGAEVSVHARDIDVRGNGYITTLTFHTGADAEIDLTKKSISVTGLQGEPTVSVFDCTKMVDSETLTIPAQGDALTLNLSELSNSSFAVTTDGESTEMQVTWPESEA